MTVSQTATKVVSLRLRLRRHLTTAAKGVSQRLRLRRQPSVAAKSVSFKYLFTT